MRKIAEVKVHEGYNRGTIANDVAVVKLSEPFSFNGNFSMEDKYRYSKVLHHIFIL